MADNQPKAGIVDVGMSWPAFTALHDHNRSVTTIAGLAAHALTLTGRGDPADVSTVAVTPDFFTLFETRPLLGRTLLPDDGNDGAAPVAVLSENLWRSRFGADPTILGRPVALDQRSFTIAGVMPASFRTPFVGRNEQFWIPLAQDPLFAAWRTRPPQAHWLPVIARLNPGVSITQAQAELDTVGAQLAQQLPSEQGWQPRIQPLQKVIVGDVKAPLIMLLCAVSLLLLIACVNIANLLLARATARSKEMAVRIALGASRQRIASQLITESAILGLLGGIAGIFLAWGSVSAFASMLPAGLPRFHPIRVDGSVLALALVVSLTASLLFGLAPILFTTRSDPQANLRDGSRAGEAKGAQQARNLLAAAEVAIAMVLLAGAGLFMRSFAHLMSVSPGFQVEHLVKAEISLPRYQYSKPEQWNAFTNDLMARLQTQHGLENSALAVPLPILDDAVTLPFTIANYVSASPQYFSVMGISLTRGRLFSSDDTATEPPVALISATLARRFFPHENPIGRRLVFGFPPNGGVSREIVGVVADIHDVSLAADPGPMMYVPFAQEPFWGAEIVVRGRLSAAAAASVIRRETHNIDPGLPVTNVETLPQALQSSLAQPRFRTLLLAIFGVLALLLSSVGIYGVISFSVSRRTRDIGVRMALGATPANLRRLVLAESANLALLGLAVGVPVALLCNHFLSTLLFGVSSADPLTYLGVALLLTLVALAAGFIPARRATRVDPIRALHYE
jgi:putative ABC transport system permease protein